MEQTKQLGHQDDPGLVPFVLFIRWRTFLGSLQLTIRRYLNGG